LADLALEPRTVALGLGRINAIAGGGGEDLRQAIRQLFLPGADLDRMNPLVLGNLVEGFDALERLKGDPRLEFGAVRSSFSLHVFGWLTPPEPTTSQQALWLRFAGPLQSSP
jgi:hypothetical protein